MRVKLNMNEYKIDEMMKGWFVGGFTPTAFKTDACEVGVKFYNAGDKEEHHYHLIVTEITLILSGRVLMAGRERVAGEIIVLSPGEVTNFIAIEDTVNVVVKVPGALDDKYLS